MLIDDQTLIRSGIRCLLNLTDDIRVVAGATDGEQALATIAEVQAGVVLLDIRMPRSSGIEVLRARHDMGRLPPPMHGSTASAMAPRASCSRTSRSNTWPMAFVALPLARRYSAPPSRSAPCRSCGMRKRVSRV